MISYNGMLCLGDVGKFLGWEGDKRLRLRGFSTV